MKTTLPDKKNIKREWKLVDADGKILGRLSTEIANILRGRHKPIYTRHLDTGDFVVVVNADKVRLSGRKETDKIYHRYSGYRSGLKEIPAEIMREKHPDQLIRLAVKGMLPKTVLSDSMLRRLKVYPGDNHPHKAQNPAPVELKLKGAKRV